MCRNKMNKMLKKNQQNIEQSTTHSMIIQQMSYKNKIRNACC